MAVYVSCGFCSWRWGYWILCECINVLFGDYYALTCVLCANYIMWVSDPLREMILQVGWLVVLMVMAFNCGSLGQWDILFLELFFWILLCWFRGSVNLCLCTTINSIVTVFFLGNIYTRYSLSKLYWIFWASVCCFANIILKGSEAKFLNKMCFSWFLAQY